MKTNPENIIQELKSIEVILNKFIVDGVLSKIENDIILSKLQQVYISVINLSENIELPVDFKKVEEVNILLDDSKSKTFEKHLQDPIEFVSTEFKNEKVQNSDEIIEVKVDISTKKTIEKKEILAEKIEIKHTPINEALSGAYLKKDLSTHLQAKGIKDIAAAIDINERFLFVRELFSGDAELYNKAISEINNASNFNEAFNYIHNTFSWNIEAEPAQKLLDLVRRRFIIEE